ncbi:DUF4085 family protein [Undibacterium flavidum]|uniref:DUF4085 family protein n=1 Tax=Undibacterium flavidum TaxID=2762297 RepID=A0ABR6Y9Y2_9BURK|nr:DUF4085 family protein [Undibacterium flavidum]MBC3873362.1 DUF4085 family protein [Undibacterium flavidum]
MKYFTKAWWENGCEDAQQLFAEYNAYLESIQDQLPKELIQFNELHTLHDAEIKRIAFSQVDAKLNMDFLGWDYEFQFPVRYHLQFLSVSRFEQIFPQADYVEQELGDLGYWEYEKLSQGIEMRMLFVSGAEFIVLFSGFEFSSSTPEAWRDGSHV